MPNVSSLPVTWRRLRTSLQWAGLVILLCLEVFLLFNHEMGGSNAAPTYVPRNAALRNAALELFAPDSGYRTPRAIIVFFGNDVGFWGPHRRLAAGLALDGYAVVGVDIRSVLAGLPDAPVARAQTVRTRLDAIIGGAYAEFDQWPDDTTGRVATLPDGAARIPLLLAGHSLGAELALWAAANVPAPALEGVVAISPGSRSHLRISAADILMNAEPAGPGSFAVGDAIRLAVRAQPDLRVAVVRGSNDPMRSADAVLLSAGGSHVRRFGVPLAGHSMKRLALAGLVVRRALDWVLVASPPTRSHPSSL